MLGLTFPTTHPPPGTSHPSLALPIPIPSQGPPSPFANLSCPLCSTPRVKELLQGLGVTPVRVERDASWDLAIVTLADAATKVCLEGGWVGEAGREGEGGEEVGRPGRAADAWGVQRGQRQKAIIKCSRRRGEGVGGERGRSGNGRTLSPKPTQAETLNPTAPRCRRWSTSCMGNPKP